MNEGIKVTTASQLDIERLYHYQPFNAGHLETLLSQQKIFATDPATLNDPWDCKPQFSLESFRNPEFLSKELDYHCRLAAKSQSHTHPASFEQLLQGLKDDPRMQAQFIEKQSRDVQSMICGYKIYCLTRNPKSILMWSHYAKDHSGVCLEFGVVKPLFSAAFEVNYVSEYPCWVLHQFENNPERTMQLFLTKAIEWNYEQEFRLINTQAGPHNHAGRLHDGYFLLPRGSLKSIIVGCQGDFDAVKSIVDRYQPGLSVRKAKRSPERYELEIEP